jgi:hypothetical protein
VPRPAFARVSVAHSAHPNPRGKWGEWGLVGEHLLVSQTGTDQRFLQNSFPARGFQEFAMPGGDNAEDTLSFINFHLGFFQSRPRN